jgi:hypothetical protein
MKNKNLNLFILLVLVTLYLLINGISNFKTRDYLSDYKNPNSLPSVDSALASDTVKMDTTKIIYHSAKKDTAKMISADTNRRIPHYHSLIVTSVPGIPGRSPASVSDEEPKSAVMCYSYPYSMSRNQTRDVNVYITVNNPASAALDSTKIIVHEQQPGGNDSTVIACFDHNVVAYKYLKVQLMDVSGAFKIDSLQIPGRQELNTEFHNQWHWKIMTASTEDSVSLIIKITAEKLKGFQDPLPEITVPIKIKISPPPFRKIWEYLVDNPKLCLTAILIPVVSYFGKKIFDGKKNDKEKDKNENENKVEAVEKDSEDEQDK